MEIVVGGRRGRGEGIVGEVGLGEKVKGLGCGVHLTSGRESRFGFSGVTACWIDASSRSDELSFVSDCRDAVMGRWRRDIVPTWRSFQ